MRPLSFQCAETIALLPEEIAELILDLSQWPRWQGYGPLPGIRGAEYAVLTDAIVGTIIRVTNTDGSQHVEEILEWDPPRRLKMRLHGFSAPLSRLATAFDETWEFAKLDEADGRNAAAPAATRVTRRFEMHPAAWWAWPTVWGISLLMRRAVRQHLQQMRDAAGNRGTP